MVNKLNSVSFFIDSLIFRTESIIKGKFIDVETKKKYGHSMNRLCLIITIKCFYLLDILQFFVKQQ